MTDDDLEPQAKQCAPEDLRPLARRFLLDRSSDLHQALRPGEIAEIRVAKLHRSPASYVRRR